MKDQETSTSEKTFTGVRHRIEIPGIRSRRTVIDLSNRPLLQTPVSDEEREAFAQLEDDHAYGWIRTSLATYLAETVHDPVRLQGLWTLSAFPFKGRRLFTLSVGGTEVLWMHGHDFVVHLNVAHGEALRHVVDEVLPDVWHHHIVYDSIERHCPVRGLLVTDANALTNLLSDPTVLDAAYRLNALLMHYGGTGLSRFHNRPFATAVLGDPS